MVSAELLLYAIIAGGLVFWLRSLLGTRHGDERSRPPQFSQPQESRTDKKDNIESLITEAAGARVQETVDPFDFEAQLDRTMSLADEATEGLRAIAIKDKSFSLRPFMGAAQDAFIYIVEAFAEGDRETLQGLLSTNVYKAFDKALDDREDKGLKATLEIHAVRKMQILDAKIKNKMAYITIRFVADETRVVEDKEGKLLEGNPDRVTETIDIWTFGREIQSKNPAWLVFETRDEDAADDEHKTVPDAE